MYLDSATDPGLFVVLVPQHLLQPTCNCTQNCWLMAGHPNDAALTCRCGSMIEGLLGLACECAHQLALRDDTMPAVTSAGPRDRVSSRRAIPDGRQAVVGCPA